MTVAPWARPDAKFGEAINEESALKYGSSDVERFLSIQGIPNSPIEGDTRAADIRRNAPSPFNDFMEEKQEGSNSYEESFVGALVLYLHNSWQFLDICYHSPRG